ncbi:MAG: CHAT domain-containing protein [Muribaculaceae bacterium]|nr:CHAT domain-containing protein [Muribaculaceae bacterium]
MMKAVSIVFIVISLITGVVEIKADDNPYDRVLELAKENDFISHQREIASVICKIFDEFVESDEFSPFVFEETASKVIDTALEMRDFISGGVILHHSLNILMDYYNSQELATYNVQYLTVSASEYYLSAGIDSQAATWITAATEFCINTNRMSGNHWIRNRFNMATLLIRMGEIDKAKEIYEGAVSDLHSMESKDVSPFTINAMLRCATELIEHVSSRFMRDTNMLLANLSDNMTDVNNVMMQIFRAKVLTVKQGNYERANWIYEQLFNSKLAVLAYKLCLTDALTTAYHISEDRYSTMMYLAGHIGLDVIFLDLNSFSLNDSEILWQRVADRLNKSHGIGLNAYTDNQFILSGAYLNSVCTKSLSTLNFNRVSDFIRESGTEEFKSVLNSIIDMRHKIAKITDKDERRKIANNMEKLELGLRAGINLSPLISQYHNKTVVMPSYLDTDECAVEILQYPHIEDGKEVMHYGAIVCTALPLKDKKWGIDYKADNYEFIDLGPMDLYSLVYYGLGTDLGDRHRALQYSRDEYVTVGNSLRPLLKNIQKYKRAYVSPTGIINMINIGALPWGDGDSIVNDKVEIIRINAAFDVTDIKARDTKLKSAAVFSNMDFNNMENVGNDTCGFDNETAGYRVKIEKGAFMTKFPRLPIYGKRLVKGIGNHVGKVDNYSGRRASEDALKRYDGNSPELIHIDTHGFYIPEEDQAFIGKHVIDGTKERALLTCGLAMSGANKAWSGEDVENGMEDGILTGWEISCLDLSGCKLAVLSACETAQGDIDRINGIIGLQRALKLAGVKAMLLTLWPVDNELTEEFINGFYERLPESKNFNEAFVETQKEFRRRHPDPYQWVPFFLIN